MSESAGSSGKCRARRFREHNMTLNNWKATKPKPNIVNYDVVV